MKQVPFYVFRGVVQDDRIRYQWRYEMSTGQKIYKVEEWKPMTRRCTAVDGVRSLEGDDAAAAEEPRHYLTGTPRCLNAASPFVHFPSSIASAEVQRVARF
jgi:hypothetical protein